MYIYIRRLAHILMYKSIAFYSCTSVHNHAMLDESNLLIVSIQKKRVRVASVLVFFCIHISPIIIINFKV